MAASSETASGTPSSPPAGYTVIRVTWRQLVDAPEAIAARIAAALAVRS